jgi:2'-5' RNA ligase
LSDTIRAFIAVPVPDETRRRLATAAHEAFGDHRHVKLVPANNIHATLKFLGEIERQRLRAVEADLKGLAKRFSAFELRVRGAGAFPDERAPRVLFAALEGDVESWIRLAQEIDALAARDGVPRETKPFHAHLTLARVKAPKELGLLRKRLGEWADYDFGPLPVREIVVYRSDLSPEGARYTPIGGVALA